MSFWFPGITTPVTSSLTPITDALYDLGSAILRWRDLFISRNATIGGNIAVTGNAAVNGTLSVTGAITFNNTLTGRNILPDGNETRDFGSSAAAYNRGYVKELYHGANAYLTSTATDLTLGSSKELLNLSPTGGSRRVNVNANFGRGAPATKTADFTLGDTENSIISNRGATNTVTLPSAAAYTGREVLIRTIQAFAVNSASANVVPRIGGAAGTAILPATDGAWALLISDGANWQIMMASS